MFRLLATLFAILVSGPGYAEMHSLYAISIDENYVQKFAEAEAVETGRIYAYHLYPASDKERANHVTVTLSLPDGELGDFDHRVLSFGWTNAVIKQYLAIYDTGDAAYPGKDSLISWLNIAGGTTLPGSFLGLTGVQASQLFRLEFLRDENGVPVTKWLPAQSETARIYFAAGSETAFFCWEKTAEGWQVLPISVPLPELEGTPQSPTAPAVLVERGKAYRVFYAPKEDSESSSWYHHVALQSGSGAALLKDKQWWLAPDVGSVVSSASLAGGVDFEQFYELVNAGDGTYWNRTNISRLAVKDLYRSTEFSFEPEKMAWLPKKQVPGPPWPKPAEEDTYIVHPPRRSPQFLPYRFFFGQGGYHPPVGYKPVGGNWYEYDPQSIPKYWHPSGGGYNP